MIVQVKICGIRRAEDARAAAVAGADALGLNFAPESPRYIGGITAARNLMDAASRQDAGAPFPRWAGVFVNPKLDDVREAVALGLQIVQLHGEETPDFVADLRSRLSPAVAIWKSFRVASATDLSDVEMYAGADAWLFDAKVPSARGGSGQRFDWGTLSGLKRIRPIVLAGGLNPGNVQAAIEQAHPDWVDTASGVETAPGVKDAALVRHFIQAARSAGVS